MAAADRREALRDALVAAAERAIAAEGLASLRARDLAREAGCAVGAIYTVFPDLDALVLAVNARTLEAVDAVLQAIPLGEGDVPSDPEAQFAALADAYCAYAARHHRRWAAVFDHRMAGGRPVPEAYLALQARLFRHIEAPLARLRPDLDPADLARLARAVFSAVHGVVSLGLDERLAPLDDEGALRAEARLLAAAMARGLAPAPGA